MRKLKTIILATLFFVFGFFNVSNVYADDDDEPTTPGYTIEKYDIDMVVNENNSFDITEKITVNFQEPRHGIYRTIPKYNTVERVNGLKTRNRVKITEVKASEQFTTSSENGNLKLKLGDPNFTITGEKTYTIQYNYNIGKDPLNDMDELYFNLFGDKWEVSISKLSFKITMPKEFEYNKKSFGFSTGAYGEVGSDDVYYRVNGKEISGYLKGTLYPQQALTVRLELPEGYFVGAGIEINEAYAILYFIPFIGAAIAAFFWFKYGKDKKMFVKPEYFPPKDANSLMVGYYYKGSAGDKEVISLLIYLANKGYLTIEETEEDGVFSKKKGFKLKKVKDYDGKDANEKEFFTGLFKSGNEVTSKDLYDEFYKTTQKIMANVNSKTNRDKMFEKNGGKIALVLLFMLVSFALIVMPPFIDYADYEDLIVALIYPSIALAVLVACFVGKSANGKDITLFAIIFSVLFGGIPSAIFILPELLIDPYYLIGFLVGFVGIVIMLVFLKLMPKRTEYGLQKYTEVAGLKMFLEAVEKDRIKKMVNENPNYFFDILPYAYVLGVSDEWIEKFEDMNLKAPDWYSGNDAFNMVMFNSFMHSTMASATSNMSSSSSHSSSGGGGFSGGGSGGGGGGSW